MPVRELIQYATHLEQLMAEENFMWAERVAIGSATLKEGDRQSVVRAWRGKLRRGVQRPRSHQERIAMAAAAGIGMRRTVIRRADPQDGKGPDASP